jgi:hypothetical protein
MKASPNAEPSSPSSRLGDWYAHTFIIRRTHYVLAVSERTLLPVVISASPIKMLVPRFLDGACDVMRAIGVQEDQLTRERGGMDDVAIGRTENRQVLGTINDFGRMLEVYLEGDTCIGASLRLAEAPCGPIQMESPRERTLHLLGSQPHLRLVKS